MANIQSYKLAADVIDRLDNAVLSGQVNDAMRRKLIAPVRILHSINQAYLIFVSKSDPAALHQLSGIVPLVADTNIPASGNLSTYTWPATAFQERIDGGIINIILNDREYLLEEATPLQSVRMQAKSVYYGDSQEVFAYDLQQKRVYAPSALTVKARVITTPEALTTIENVPVPGPTDVVELKIDEVYMETISLLATRELLKAGENPDNIGIIAQDNPVTLQPQA